MRSSPCASAEDNRGRYRQPGEHPADGKRETAQFSIQKCDSFYFDIVLGVGAGTATAAQSGHCHLAKRCLLSGVKQTSAERTSMSAYDPKRT
jgi:hypothetical protein